MYVLGFQNVVNQDPSRARQNSLATAEKNVTKPLASIIPLFTSLTQVQSLSEETSSAEDGDGRTSSKILTPSNFGSEDDEEGDGDTEDDDEAAKGGGGEAISRRKILAANGIGLAVGGDDGNRCSNSPSNPPGAGAVSPESGMCSPSYQTQH